MRMGLWQRVKSMFGSDVSVEGQSMLSAIFPSGVPPRRGSRELMIAYRSMPWLHAAVRRIGENVSKTCWRLYRARSSTAAAQQRAVRRDTMGRYQLPGADEVLKHPFLELLKKPNPTLHRLPFWASVSAYIDLKGESPIVLERADDGLPVELWPTPPHWLAETPSAGQPFYRFQWNAWRRSVAEGDVLYMRHPDVENPYGRGAGTGEALADELDIDEFAAKHVASYFYNRAMPDAFVSLKNVKDANKAAEWEERIRNKYRGSARAWQVHVTNAEIDVKTIAQNFKDMQLSDLRTIQRDTVIQVFGVPPEIMGIVQNSNRATISAADFIFQSKVIVPRLNFIADALTELVREWDEELFIAYESPVEEDAEFRLKVMSAQPSLFTKNEWRELAKLPPREGWDEEFALSTPGAGNGPGLPGAKPPELPEGEPVAEPASEEPPELEDGDDEKSARGPRLLTG